MHRQKRHSVDTVTQGRTWDETKIFETVPRAQMCSFTTADNVHEPLDGAGSSKVV